MSAPLKGHSRAEFERNAKVKAKALAKVPPLSAAQKRQVVGDPEPVMRSVALTDEQARFVAKVLRQSMGSWQLVAARMDGALSQAYALKQTRMCEEMAAKFEF